MSEADRLEAERLAKAEAERKAEEEAKEKAKEEAAAKEIEDAVWGKKIDEYRKMLIESGMNTVLAVEHTSLMAPKKTRQKTLLLIDGLRKRKSIEERK
jgi:predicted cobalt transporter CbtA